MLLALSRLISKPPTFSLTSNPGNLFKMNADGVTLERAGTLAAGTDYPLSVTRTDPVDASTTVQPHTVTATAAPATPPWYKAYTVNGTDPVVAIDLENGLTWDGTNVGVAVNTLISGGTVTPGVGMQAALGITAIGALKTALSGTIYSARMDCDGGVPVTANARDGDGLISFGTTVAGDAPLFGTGENSTPKWALRCYRNSPAASLDTVQGTTIVARPGWYKRCIFAMSQDATYRRLTVGGSGVVVKDTNKMTAYSGTITLGSFAGAYVYGKGGSNGSGTAGYMKLILVYPFGFDDDELVLMGAPRSPITAKRGLSFAQGQFSVVSEQQGSLKYASNQPFTTHVQAICAAYPSALSEIQGYQAGLLFTNSSVTANGGYELWVDAGGFLHTRLMVNFGQPMYLGAISTNVIVDGLLHTFAMTYDGSSTYAGVKMYMDGVPVAQAQESGSQSPITGSIATNADVYEIGNQIGYDVRPDDRGTNVAWERGFMWPGSIFSAAQQNRAYSQAEMLAVQSLPGNLPANDANTEFRFELTEQIGMTAVDSSAKGRTLTLLNVPRSNGLPRWV